MADPAPPSRLKILPGLIEGWTDLYASARRRLETPAEEREILFWAFLAAGLGFLAGLPGAFRQASGMAEEDALTAVIAGRLFASLFGAPLLFYGIAALSRLICRLLGGEGTWQRARVAFFWSLLVATPFLFLGAVGALIGGWSAPIASFVAAAGFLFVWAAHLAPAEGFAHPTRVFMVMIGVVAASAMILVGLPG